jgi:hypothetical protein
MSDALLLRDAVILARARYHRGEISVDALYAAADAYIAELRAYKKRTGKRMSIPNRAYLLRAL